MPEQPPDDDRFRRAALDAVLTALTVQLGGADLPPQDLGALGLMLIEVLAPEAVRDEFAARWRSHWSDAGQVPTGEWPHPSLERLLGELRR